MRWVVVRTVENRYRKPFQDEDPVHNFNWPEASILPCKPFCLNLPGLRVLPGCDEPLICGDQVWGTFPDLISKCQCGDYLSFIGYVLSVEYLSCFK